MTQVRLTNRGLRLSDRSRRAPETPQAHTVQGPGQVPKARLPSRQVSSLHWIDTPP